MEHRNENELLSTKFLILITLFISSYVMLSISSEQGAEFPFIVNLYYQILCTFVNNILYIFDYIQLHILNLILISYPEPYSSFLQRYKIDISGPFSRLFPKLYTFLTSKFPLFELSSDTTLKIAKLHIKVGMWIAKNPTQYSILSNVLIGIIVFYELYDRREIISRLFNSKFVKIWFTIFFIFLVFYKWIFIKGPGYERIEEKTEQVDKFHLIVIHKFFNLFAFNKKTNEDKSFFEKQKEKASNIYKQGKDFINDISQMKVEDTILNLDERLGAFYYSLFQTNDNSILYKIKMIHPQPFDHLFVYFIYSFIWSLIISAILSLVGILFSSNDEKYN